MAGNFCCVDTFFFPFSTFSYGFLSLSVHIMLEIKSLLKVLITVAAQFSPSTLQGFICHCFWEINQLTKIIIRDLNYEGLALSILYP